MTDPLMKDTVTIYNRYSRKDGANIKVMYNRTVLKGVRWKVSANRNQSSDGRSFLDTTISVIIPVDVNSDEKAYIDPGHYPGIPVDDKRYWTMAIDTVNPDIVVRGECPAEITESYTIVRLVKEYPAMQIRAVADNTNVDADMSPHWKVMGV